MVLDNDLIRIAAKRGRKTRPGAAGGLADEAWPPSSAPIPRLAAGRAPLSRKA
jgi:hypothetical protein